MNLSEVRSLFVPQVNLCMGVGGYGDSEGFSRAAATPESRELFARNIVATVERLGYDCIGM